MNKKYTFILPGLLLLAACGGQKTENTVASSADSATVLVNQPATEAVEEKQPEEIVIDKVVKLLVKDGYCKKNEENEWLEAADEKHQGNYCDIQYEQNEDCTNCFNVGAIKRADGTYQVLVFDNSGCGMFATNSVSCFIFDGEKLTKNNIELPKPKYLDFMDGLTYFGLDQQTIRTIKDNKQVGEFACYEVREGGLSVSYAFSQELQNIDFELCATLLDNLTVKYDFVGDKFVPRARHLITSVSPDHVGALFLGKEYKGENIEGYEVEKLADGYMLKKNAVICVKVVTKADIINEIAVLGGDYAFVSAFVGANLNEMNNEFDLLSEIERRDGNIVLNRWQEMWFEFPEKDLIGFKESEDHKGRYGNFVFAKDAKLKAFYIKLKEENE